MIPSISSNTHNLSSRIEYCIARFSERRPQLVVPWDRIQVSMSHRLRRCLGVCKYYRATGIVMIEFSESIFRKVDEGQKTETVAHELAHAVEFLLDGKSDHGYNWKRLCVDMGGNGDRTASLPLGTVKSNIVTRKVYCKKSDPKQIAIVTLQQERKSAIALSVNYTHLGSILVDRSTTSYRWSEVVSPELREVAVMPGKWVLRS